MLNLYTVRQLRFENNRLPSEVVKLVTIAKIDCAERRVGQVHFSHFVEVGVSQFLGYEVWRQSATECVFR